MKIIQVPMVDDLNMSERLVASGIESQYELRVMLTALRGSLPKRPSMWYEAVPDDQQLKVVDPTTGAVQQKRF